MSALGRKRTLSPPGSSDSASNNGGRETTGTVPQLARLCRVSDEPPAFWRSQAEKCRRLATSTLDRDVARMLHAMAEEYDQKAKELSGRKA